MKPGSAKLIVFSAAAFEVEPLRKLLAGSDILVEYFEVGVGALAAAQNSHFIASKSSGKHSLFIGTCGAFGEFSTPEIFTASSTVWLPACERAGLSYPVPNSAPEILFETRGILAGDLPPVKVICAPNISLTNTLPETYASESCVENLELYSCADALLKNSLSVSVLLCSTNAVGKGAHGQWKSNFALAAQMTAEFVKENLWRLK